MDGLSGAASIVTLVGLLATVTKYVHEAKAATEEKDHLVSELSSVSHILSTLLKLIETSHSSSQWNPTLASLAAEGGPIKQVTSVLEKLERAIGPSSTKFNKLKASLSWPLRKSEVLQMINTIHRQQSLFIIALQNDHSLLEISIKKDIEEIGHNVNSLIQRSFSKEDEELLQWLSDAKPRQKHQDIKSKRVLGTGKWLFETDQFKSWKNASGNADGILFCFGNPGIGKTYLSSLVVDTILPQACEDVGFAYFYCDYNDREKQTPQLILSALLKQLVSLQSAIPQPLKRLHDECKRDNRSPELAELKLFLAASCGTFKEVFILLDALDECDERTCRKLLLKELNSLSSACKIFITSRPYAKDIKTFARERTQISVTAHDEDIKLFLGHIIDQDADPDVVDQTLASEIIESLTKEADGMFLLPSLRIQAIIEQPTKSKVRSTLKDQPGTLDSAFMQTVGRIKEQSTAKSELGMLTLVWVAFAARPLVSIELKQALAINLGDTCFDFENVPSLKQLLDLCMGLIVLDTATDTVRFVHHLVYTFFTQHSGQLPHGDMYLAQICLNFLSLDDFSSGPCLKLYKLSLRMSSYPFLLYAAPAWSIHARPFIRRLKNRILDFLECGPQMIASEQILHLYSARHDRFVGCNWTFGCTPAIQPEIKALLSLEDWACARVTPLHISSAEGFDLVTEELLNRGLSVNHYSPTCGWPLTGALQSNEISVVKQLRDAGATLPAQSDNSRNADLLRASACLAPSREIRSLFIGDPRLPCTRDDWTEYEARPLETRKMIIDTNFIKSRKLGPAIKPLLAKRLAAVDTFGTWLVHPNSSPEELVQQLDDAELAIEEVMMIMHEKLHHVRSVMAHKGLRPNTTKLYYFKEGRNTLEYATDY